MPLEANGCILLKSSDSKILNSKVHSSVINIRVQEKYILTKCFVRVFEYFSISKGWKYKPVKCNKRKGYNASQINTGAS